MATSPVTLAQSKFLMNGGGYELALAQMREKGLLAESYVFLPYPKAIHISRGMSAPMPRRTETCEKGVYVDWVDAPHEIFETIIVNSEEEEERVIAGGKTSVQLEEDRQGYINRCHNLSIPVDPSWSVVRLRRELGDALDAPEPANEMVRLEAELAALHKMAAMRAEIAALKAQIAGEPPEPVLEAPIEELGDSKRRKAS